MKSFIASCSLLDRGMIRVLVQGPVPSFKSIAWSHGLLGGSSSKLSGSKTSLYSRTHSGSGSVFFWDAAAMSVALVPVALIRARTSQGSSSSLSSSVALTAVSRSWGFRSPCSGVDTARSLGPQASDGQ